MTYEDLKRLLARAYMDEKHVSGFSHLIPVPQELLTIILRVVDEVDKQSMGSEVVGLSQDVVDALNALDDYTDEEKDEVMH